MPLKVYEGCKNTIRQAKNGLQGMASKIGTTTYLKTNLFKEVELELCVLLTSCRWCLMGLGMGLGTEQGMYLGLTRLGTGLLQRLGTGFRMGLGTGLGTEVGLDLGMMMLGITTGNL